MTLSAFLLAAIAVIPADRLAMADRLFNRGEYAAARVEYAALRGEKSIPADEVIYRLAECDRALGKSAEARHGYGELLEKFPTSPRADRSRLMRALAGTPEERAAELKVLDSDRVANDIRAAADHFPVAARGEALILEFLFDGLHLQILNRFGGAHQSRRSDQAGQFVAGIEYLFHFMLGP